MVLAEYYQNTLKWQVANIFMITVFEFDGILLKPCLLQPCFHVAGGDPEAAAGRFSKCRLFFEMSIIFRNAYYFSKCRLFSD